MFTSADLTNAYELTRYYGNVIKGRIMTKLIINFKWLKNGLLVAYDGSY